MRIINQTKNTISMRLKSTMLIVMVFTSFASFAGESTESFMDSGLNWMLLGMIGLQIALLYVIAGVFKALTSNVSVWKKYGKVTAAVITAVMVLSGNSVFAQGSGAGSGLFNADLQVLLMSINGFLLLMIIILLVNIKKITNALKASATDEDTVAVEDGVFSSLGFTDAVAIEDEDAILLDHDYDGIHELDNNLPPWWLWGFYITIAWAGVYSYYYLSSENLKVGNNEYVAEMQVAAAEAELRGASVDEESVKLLTSEADIAAGLEIYTTNCVACHLASGGGSVGPNLTDEFWMHGGGIKNVFRTIKVGVPEKGMISWESQLSPTDIQKVASFVLSLQGTAPADGKDPQGDKWTDK